MIEARVVRNLSWGLVAGALLASCTLIADIDRTKVTGDPPDDTSTPTPDLTDAGTDTNSGSDASPGSDASTSDGNSDAGAASDSGVTPDAAAAEGAADSGTDAS